MGSDQSKGGGGGDSNLNKPQIVNFLINGKDYKINIGYETYHPNSTLLDFIREKCGLMGTKVVCREGGCGACLVGVRERDKIKAVNSCLVPVVGCMGWDIVTIEGLQENNQIAKQISKEGGSQCGFCSPGMTMSMFCLLKSNPKLSQGDIEEALNANICRCTGYRPIMDACKSFANVSVQDIEDLVQEKDKCTKKYEICFAQAGELLELNLSLGKVWLRPVSLDTLFTILSRFKEKAMNYRFVAGNTSIGLYGKEDDYFQAFVDINQIPELTDSTSVSSTKLILGAGLTLSKIIEIFKNQVAHYDGFSYAEKIIGHLKRVGTYPVRNLATIAGNLMLKHRHRDFPSDIFTILEGLGATLKIAYAPNLFKIHSLLEFLDLDMNGKLIISIQFPFLPASQGYFFRSCKVSSRFQNSLAYINAAFLMKLDIGQGYQVQEKPRLVFGGIDPSFIHASKAEIFLYGKRVQDQSNLQVLMNNLDSELNPNNSPLGGSPDYRRALAKSLIYKYILGILDKIISPRQRSGSNNLQRNLTRGTQTYDSDPSLWPVNQAVEKLEGRSQCNGRAEYINDINPQIGELFGVFVLSNVAKATIVKIDPSIALSLPGVVTFLSAKDIPGNNDYINGYDKEEIFAEKEVQFHGQAVGMIIAETRIEAKKGADAVKVFYKNVQKPILTIKDSLKKNKNIDIDKEDELESEEFSEEEVNEEETEVNVKPKPKPRPKPNPNKPKPKIILKGQFAIGGQYHFNMETQTSLCIPKEDGNLDIFSSTQWMDHVQMIVSNALKIPNNAINIKVKRLGGAYGAKLTRASQIAAASALGAWITNKPVRVVLDLEDNIKMVGKRLPYLSKYRVGVDERGRILKCKGKVICDTGFTENESTAFFARICMQNCYGIDIKGFKTLNAKTSTAANTFCRAPGSVQGIAIIENIMEHISRATGLEPMEVRFANLVQEENLIPKMLEELAKSSDYLSRKAFVQNFNRNNRWKKRGLGIVPIRYPVHYFGSSGFTTFIAIYSNDGSVAIEHSGIEMGQGINTKVAQVVARELYIPLSFIKISASTNLIGANAPLTGSTVSSELVCFAAIKACGTLLKRIQPVRNQMDKNTPWRDIIAECHRSNVDLTASYTHSPRDQLRSYDVWAINLTEVQIDVLTGEFKIVRVDLIEDAGKSISPSIDIGQIEGALVMGLGLWTTEKLIYHNRTGELLTNRTFNYRPPLLNDIPEDIRITLLKNASNPFGVLRSKATGEPPICTSVAVIFALRDAIDSAREDAGRKREEFFQMDGPVLPEDVFKYCLTSSSMFSF